MKCRHQSGHARFALIGAALMVVCAILAGCSSAGSRDGIGSNAQAATGSLSISGSILDAVGNPLAGVTMHLNGSSQATATSSSAGTFSFTGLGSGSYSVNPQLSGCNFDPTVVNLNNLTANATVFFDAFGPSCGGDSQNHGARSGSLTISGTVRDGAGNPVPGVQIRLNGNAQGLRTTTAAGTYSFQVDAGNYNLHTSAPCRITPNNVNLNHLAASFTQDFLAGEGCVGVPQDGGVSDSGPPDVCVPATCSAVGRVCGSLSDGCGGTLNCGTCPAGQTCNAGGQCEVVCVPTTCSAAGRVCGPLSDGCGGTLDCGTCPAGQTCNDAGQCVTVCVPTTCSAAGRVCGPLSDGCGGTLDCGACPAGQTCNAAGQCVTVCVPTTCQAAGRVCGPLSDGCGGTLDCGTCPAGQTCNDAGQCTAVCVPTTCQAAGRVCGPLSDGCGATLDCGACPTGSVCNASGTACIFENPCGIGSNTAACLTSRGSACLQCATDSGCLDPAQIGGVCEGVSGAQAACQTLIGGTAAPTETQLCLRTLSDIFSSGCASDGQETPCLCGMVDPVACQNGSATPLGPAFPVYQCDLGPAISSIVSNFTNPAFGAGMANTIVQCVAAFGCTCF